MSFLDFNTIPISKLPGIGSSLVEKFARLNVYSIFDLLLHLPFRYEDRTKITQIANLKHAEYATVEGVIQHIEVQIRKSKILICTINDGTHNLGLKFFHYNQAIINSLQIGKKIKAFGEVKGKFYKFEMLHPEYKIVNSFNATTISSNTLTPIYHSTYGLNQNQWRKIITIALNFLTLNPIEELLDQAINPFKIKLQEAIYFLHNPPNSANINDLLNFQTLFQKRLIYEELLAYILAIKQTRLKLHNVQSHLIKTSGELQQKFMSNLPFKLTKAQNKVCVEIEQNLQHRKPMMRLVQGDVGSGKTIIAIYSAFLVAKNNKQVAIMAPTEILAEQHMVNFKKILQTFDIKIELLIGKTKAKKKREILEKLVTREIDILIGTHALFQETVEFDNLALVIIDEQHRFGVQQRLNLLQKGIKNEMHPHQLIMTATPIPRTLTMTLYTDLDISIIDELPPGRKPIQTVLISEEKREQVIKRIHNTCINDKRQVYWVCTLIEESEALEAKAAEELHKELSEKIPVAIGLIHGRMNAVDKQKIMQDFKNNTIQILVATTVIEVGVDVPNASLMIIENPERLGLSQLHQLRGRIGRGQIQSYCVLLYNNSLSMLAKQRLMVIRDSQDGFYIAERDLEIRGAGEILGIKQTGIVEFKIADLIRDAELIKLTQHHISLLLQEYGHIIEPLINRWLYNKVSYKGV